jgi:hypothetical protein
MLFNADIVYMVLDKAHPDDIEQKAIEWWGDDGYYSASNLVVRWIPEGTRFRIKEYDGSESIILLDDEIFTA